MTGRFVAVEGIDGAGTTTLSRRLVDALAARGEKACWTCEPTDGPVGKLLRQVLKGTDARGGGPSPATMALLFAADRMDHLAGTIAPALAEGAWVVSDRYYHSTLAYQGVGEDFDWIRALHRGARAPDVTLLLDVTVQTAVERRRADAARSAPELFDAPGTQAAVAERYRALPARLAGERIIVLDGARDADAVLLAALVALGVAA
ncbi:MAG TPA: dTMP kinase [Myxococcota bacterium]|jgi:dTMP kinase|nr:dTMP kinase [Myxococcota bacterium]